MDIRNRIVIVLGNDLIDLHTVMDIPECTRAAINDIRAVQDAHPQWRRRNTLRVRLGVAFSKEEVSEATDEIVSLVLAGLGWNDGKTAYQIVTKSRTDSECVVIRQELPEEPNFGPLARTLKRAMYAWAAHHGYDPDSCHLTATIGIPETDQSVDKTLF